MRKSVILMLLLLCSCQKKKSSEEIVQRPNDYVQPASQDEIDTTQSYISPSDALSDHSVFDQDKFQSQQIRYRGLRKISYDITSSKTMNNDLTIVIEYVHGTTDMENSVRTASRILLFAKNALVYRKAFSIEFSNTVQLFGTRTFNNIIFAVSPTKAIIYYWLEIVRKTGAAEKEYHAISVDKEGVSNELSGDLNRIGESYGSIQFLNESKLKAKVHPNSRYPYLFVDLIYSIDWKLCNASLDVPVDTVFVVSEQPSRFFTTKIKLHIIPNRSSPYRETTFRKLTQGQMQRIFVPSQFNKSDIHRDMVFVEFNKTTSGWIDFDMMIFEEIITEN